MGGSEYVERNGLIDRLQSWDDDISELLEESRGSVEEQLELDLERIEDQLEARDVVHEEIVNELEWTVEWYTDRLESLYKTGRGRRDGERERLKDRVEGFYEKLRRELRGHWRDRQELEQERRELRREIMELEESWLSEFI